MTMQTGLLNKAGKPTAPIVIITDAPGKHAYDTGAVMSKPQMDLIKKLATDHDIPGTEFCMVNPCPPIPEEIETSERKVGDFLTAHRTEFLEILKSTNPKLIVTLGKTALRQLAGRAVKITQARGSLTTFDISGDIPVLPLLSPAHALRRPEVLPVFIGDFRQIAVLRESGWDQGVFEQSIDDAQYEWCLDLTDLLTKRPACISLDTETIGLDWRNGRQAVLTASLTTREGHAYVVPFSADYFNHPELRGGSSNHLPTLSQEDVDRLLDQLAELLGDPQIKVTGHNLKYDIHHLKNYGIEVANWYVDSMQLAFAVDDNMERKSLDECVRRWVPAMAGYADNFNTDDVHEGKSRMDLVPHDQMLRYAGGDTDSCFRLTETLCKLCKEDSRQWRAFRGVMMPGLQAFVGVEEAGIGIDIEALIALGAEYDIKERERYIELIEMAAKKAPAVLRKHENKGLSFGQAAFVSDLLFTPEGYGLTPRVWTPGTRKLPMEERIPSVSTKEHLPFFEHVPFVRKLIEYQKLTKLRSTYIGKPGQTSFTRIERLKSSGRYPATIVADLTKAGVAFVDKKSVPVRRRNESPNPVGGLTEAGRVTVDEQGTVWRRNAEEPSGFWQHLTGGSHRIHPSFRLDATVTGRTSSQNPNAQNFPKRGPMAKDFRRIFVPSNGYVLIEADLSQAELRIAAWMANEKHMLQIYQDGGDIHAATAAGVMGIPLDQVTKEDRQKAKAINFGFLYGMWWKKFMDYAKTDYGVTFTPKQAEAIRERFFDLYPGLAAWHKAMKDFVVEHGYVRSLHGALRRLPSINSSEESIKQEVQRQAINSPVQRFASDLGVMAMARFSRDCPRELMRPVAFIHDAVIVEARLAVVDEAASALRFYMQSNPLHLFDLHPPIPILSDVSIGTSLAAMEERPEILSVAPEWYQAHLDEVIS
jgi:uracil-DNA glycosylase family 4